MNKIQPIVSKDSAVPIHKNGYNWLNLMRNSQVELRMLAIVILLGAVLSFVSPYFLTMHNILNLMDQTVVIGIASIGATIVILTAGIDLSVGSVLGMAGIALGLSFKNFGVFGAILVSLSVGALAGLISGLLVAKLKIAPFVATLGMMAIGRSQAYVLSGARSINDIPDAISLIGSETVIGFPINFLILVFLYLLTWFFLMRTKIGRCIYAIGSNKESARIAGIAVDRYTILTYVISGFTAALSSIFLCAQILSIDPIGGSGLELDTIAAAVIGGTSLFGGRGSIIGTLLGVFIMVIIRNGLNLLGVNPYWQGTAIGSIIIGALVMDQLFNSNRSDT